MLFNSYLFVLAFLPVVLAAWWLLPLRSEQRLATLAGASYVFYGLWDWRFTGLLAASTLLDYAIGKRLHAATTSGGRKRWMLASVSLNLGVLAVFKYAGFAASSFNSVAAWLQSGGRLPVWDIVLPVGISFYTFQTMSYATDIYRREAKPASSIWHFAAYVSMFPQLVAGPIVRYADVDAQLKSATRRIDWNQFASGVRFFVAGMAQKVLLADLMASRIAPLWEEPAQLQLVGAWFAMLGYAVQLYFDFAGYSNMAVGLGRMLGFEFCQNFDSPYQSESIQAFWRRWHMSLGRMLRDYLFIPLGGNRGGAILTVRNLLAVMLLGGLWHGAGWTFVLWGAYHGALLAVNALWRIGGGFTLPRSVAQAATFLAVVGGWVLFRAASLQEAGDVYGAMLGARGVEGEPLAAVGGVAAAAVLAALLSATWFLPNLWRIPERLNAWSGALAAAVLTLCLLRFDSASPFLYFQF
ncbi:MAG: MBOAT family protein [Planctomycetales bacterium]|nr:MBOAT family protein [Planctomycetales bacterium]